jgi:AcrR family transcriptional regulator
MPADKIKTREPLSIPLIHSTALEAINRDGLEALSMRSLAKALNVDPMAIYHHIPNKAALLSGIYEGVIAELFDAPNLETSWQDQLKHLLRRFRSLATRSPNIFPGLIASTHTSPGMARAIDTILGILLEAGLPAKTTVQTGDTVFAFITGFVLLELNHKTLNHNTVNTNEPSHELAEELPLANIARLREELRTNQFSDSFEFGLNFLISGIEVNLSLEPTKKRKPRKSQA